MRMHGGCFLVRLEVMLKLHPLGRRGHFSFQLDGIGVAAEDTRGRRYHRLHSLAAPAEQ